MFWLCLISSFLIVALGQPARIPELGYLAAAVGFALFWKSMLQLKEPRSRFLLAFGWFGAVQMIQLSWMATTQYMGPLIVVVYLFMNLALGVQFGALSMFLRPQMPIGALRALAMGGVWVFFEWTRLFPCTGFTWNPVGLFLSSSIYSLQWASVFGIYGLSFWVILVNVSALKLFTQPFSKRGAAVFCSLALFPYLFGLATLKGTDGERELKAILVQTGIMPEQKDYYASQSYAFVPAVQQWDRILHAIRSQAGTKPDLIVLPEGALPYGAFRYGYYLEPVHRTWERHFGPGSTADFPPAADRYASFEQGRWRATNAYWIQALANHYQADVIVGLDDEDYNAAFLFRPGKEGAVPQRYEKRILVPVGEYVPFGGIRLVSDYIARQFGVAFAFAPGNEAKLFHGTVPLAVSICYEETFSGLIREARLKGAELFVNISNNAWFPSSKLAQQHFDHGLIRAVENGVSVLRACNTGITGGIDSYGRTIDLLPPSEHKAEALAIKIPVASHQTPYIIWGDLAILILSGAFILFFVVSGQFIKKRECGERPKKKLP